MESPITKLRKEIGLSKEMMASELLMTTSRYNHVEDGAMPMLPALLPKLAEASRGVGEGQKFVTEYSEWRRSLTPETIKQLEKGLWPAGIACGMCP